MYADLHHCLSMEVRMTQTHFSDIQAPFGHAYCRHIHLKVRSFEPESPQAVSPIEASTIAIPAAITFLFILLPQFFSFLIFFDVYISLSDVSHYTDFPVF